MPSVDINKIMRYARRELGWNIELTAGNNHYRWIPPDDPDGFVASYTPGDQRGERNFLAALKRHGLDVRAMRQRRAQRPSTEGEPMVSYQTITPQEWTQLETRPPSDGDVAPDAQGKVCAVCARLDAARGAPLYQGKPEGWRPFSQYYHNKRRGDGYGFYCKVHQKGPGAAALPDAETPALPPPSAPVAPTEAPVSVAAAAAPDAGTGAEALLDEVIALEGRVQRVEERLDGTAPADGGQGPSAALARLHSALEPLQEAQARLASLALTTARLTASLEAVERSLDAQAANLRDQDSIQQEFKRVLSSLIARTERLERAPNAGTGIRRVELDAVDKRVTETIISHNKALAAQEERQSAQLQDNMARIGQALGELGARLAIVEERLAVVEERPAASSAPLATVLPAEVLLSFADKAQRLLTALHNALGGPADPAVFMAVLTFLAQDEARALESAARPPKDARDG